MTTVATALADADFAKRQGQIIADNKKMVECDFLLLHPVGHSLSAQIHISGWLDEDKGASARFHFRAIGVTNLAKRNIGRLSQSVQYFKSYVVAGVGVFSTNVAQPYNQIFHNPRLLCFSSCGSIGVESCTCHFDCCNHNVLGLKDFETVEA